MFYRLKLTFFSRKYSTIGKCDEKLDLQHFKITNKFKVNADPISSSSLKVEARFVIHSKTLIIKTTYFDSPLLPRAFNPVFRWGSQVFRVDMHIGLHLCTPTCNRSKNNTIGSLLLASFRKAFNYTTESKAPRDVRSSAVFVDFRFETGISWYHAVYFFHWGSLPFWANAGGDSYQCRTGS